MPSRSSASRTVSPTSDWSRWRPTCPSKKRGGSCVAARAARRQPMSEATARKWVETDLLDDAEAGELAVEFDDRPPEDLLSWAFERFGARIALCTSFQAEGMVLLDMAWRIDPKVRVFTIDT